jgi:DNA (cytosine-5)-methyltransferase 1
MPAIAFNARQDPDVYAGHTGPLDTDGSTQGILSNWRVRRLVVSECEKLQGFKPGYTAITYRGKPAADGPRYKALGNSMAVNVMRWIGMRIQQCEGVPDAKA